MSSVATPTTTMTPTLIASCSTEPNTSPLRYAIATAMLAAAGMVVTEMKTPTSALLFAVDKDNIPAIAASAATIADDASGREMNNMLACSLGVHVAGPTPEAIHAMVASHVTAMPTLKPTTSANSGLRARSKRRCEMATHVAASGPN